MIASRPLPSFGNSDRSALDLPVAALAGLAVAFAAFTIPDDILADAVSATGIGSIITAAQPPLGTTARVTLAVAGAIAAFGGALFLLRWLDRFASKPSTRPADPIAEGPRIRKSDAHPDAPPPRPISASRDLGEPAPPSAPAEPGPVAQAATVEPVATAPADVVPTAPVRRPAVERVAPARPMAEPESLTALMARLERGLARREAQPEPVVPTRAEKPDDFSPAPVSQAAAAPAEAPPPANDRLQSAIEGLRALSGRA